MRWLIVLFVFMCTSIAGAQEIATIPSGDDVIIDLQKGEPAPFAGQLFDTDTAIRWGFWLQQYKLRLKEDVVREQRDCMIKLEYKDRELQIKQDMHVEIESGLEKRLLNSEKGRIAAEEDARNPPFWKSFQFGLVVGVVVSGVAAVLVAWGANLFQG